MSSPKMQECARKIERLAEVYRSYSGDDELQELYEAYNLACAAHIEQKRDSGEPYIVHPIATAEILTELHVDKITLIAALLHDTVEDTAVTKEELAAKFGEAVAELVDGVTKLSKFKYNSREELQAENFRKMFLAMSNDIRVVLIKLADRLHNMRTMKHKEPEKQREKAQETLDIYAPLAHRLGIYKMKWELEDLSLRFIDTEVYYELVAAIAQKRSEREEFLENIVAEIHNKVTEKGIEADIEGRPKHFYSIYRKMKAQERNIDEIYDLFATRIIVPTVSDCYSVLGWIHELYRPMPGRFKDYIATPKPNLYRSLHTTVLGPHGIPFEVQIRTFDMHREAEFGIAAHWKYKEGKSGANKNETEEARLAWLRQLLEWSKDMRDASEYLDTLKGGLIEEEVFVFTPKGRVISLPTGSSPIDFAYHIHSDVGNSMQGAKVNGHMVSIDYKLQNGDIVEITRSPDRNKGPSRDWLKIVKSASARNKISAWFKKSMRGENISRGKELLEREVKKSGFTATQLLRKDYLEKMLQRYSLSQVDDLLAGIGYGGLAAGRIVPLLREEFLRSLSEEERSKLGYVINANGMLVYSPKSILTREDLLKTEHPSLLHEERKRRKSDSSAIQVRGMANCLTKLARCCTPVPGDAVIGFITRGTGVTVHRCDCSNIRHIMAAAERSSKDAERASRLIDVSWGADDDSKNFAVQLTIIARDRTHLLADISSAIAEEKVSIISARTQALREFAATLFMVVELSNQAQLDKLCNRIRSVPGVVAVNR